MDALSPPGSLKMCPSSSAYSKLTKLFLLHRFPHRLPTLLPHSLDLSTIQEFEYFGFLDDAFDSSSDADEDAEDEACTIRGWVDVMAGGAP